MRKVYYILVPCAFILTSSWFFSTQHLINTNKISSCHKSEISWSKYKGLWIISECWQRLGTMLSAFSSLYAREMDFSHKMFLHRSQANTLKYYFDIKTPLRIVDDIISRVQIVSYNDTKKHLCSKIKDKSRGSRKQEVFDVGGNPFDMSLFKKYIPHLRKNILHLKPRFKKHANEVLLQAKQIYIENNNLTQDAPVSFVCIHNRRGDYKQKLKRNKKSFLQASYFKKASQLMHKYYKHPLFLVISDSPNVTERKLAFDNAGLQDKIFFVGDGDSFKPSRRMRLRTQEDHFITEQDSKKSLIPVGDNIGNDLAIMMASNGTILTYGNFGVWGAILGHSKHVILPSGYEEIYENRMLSEIKEAKLPGWIFIDT